MKPQAHAIVKIKTVKAQMKALEVLYNENLVLDSMYEANRNVMIEQLAKLALEAAGEQPMANLRLRRNVQ